VPEGQIGKIALAIALLSLMSVPAFAQSPHFTPGNLVVSVAGCGVYGSTTCATPPVGGTGATTGSGSGTYGDDQAAPWSLWQYTVTNSGGTLGATFMNSIQLPQTISGANFPISDDFGSQSEGTIQLSGNGAYLTMMGYGINAASFNVNPIAYCPGSTILSNACVPENGNPAAAQTGSVLGETYSGNTPVPRVAVEIDANGNVNSSTVLYGIYNQNDARSAYSPDGFNIYVSGQGCKNWDPTDQLCDSASKNYDDTQGVYLTTLGANNFSGSNNPTAITGPDNGPTGCMNTTNCTSSESTRMVQIYNNTLYVSADDKPGGTGYNRSLIGTLGDPAATSLFTCTGVGGGCGSGYGPYGPALMPGFGNTGATGKYTMNTVGGTVPTINGNNLNAGLAINLSPQNFFFASPTVMYVADTGSPKNNSNGPDTGCPAGGNFGDGGLQKWILNPTFTAGVTSSGSTSTKETVTASSTGAFTQGEVNLTITDSLGYIPAGTTITAVSAAGKSVTMSAAATGTSSSDVITVHGWSLAYTLYNGLNLVANSDCNASSPTGPGDLATTGLYGVTGVVNSGVATLYVTTYPNNDLVQTYLYGITDTLSTTTITATTAGTTFTLLDTAPVGSILRGVSWAPTIPAGSVEILGVASGAPAGLQVTTAGTDCAPGTYTTPTTLSWTGASNCTLSVTSPQTAGGVQYTFAQWQDSTTSTSDTVTAPFTTTYTATFTPTEYQLTTSAGPGGTVSAGGYIAAGTNATITATPSAGYTFVNFTFPAGVAPVTSNPLTLPMNAPESVTANFAPQGTQTTASATYTGLNTIAQGTWTGTFGHDGASIANDANNPPTVPSYATLSLTGDSLYTWSSTTTAASALQDYSGASGPGNLIASAYYSGASFNINLNLTDGNTHQISLYLLDYDAQGRAETISVLNASTNAVLATQSFSNFTNGEYAIFNVSGNVIIQATDNAGANAVVSGIFFDPVPSNSATYVGLDTTTQGTWTGKYGADGAAIANDINMNPNPPAYATLGFTGDSLYTWSSTTTAASALQDYTGATGSGNLIASCYYSGTSFSINLNLTDGNKHQISLYLLDYDTQGRAETISILNATTQTVLYTGSYSNFTSGEYAIFDITGNVIIQVTTTAGVNSVVSGIFFDTPALVSVPNVVGVTQAQAATVITSAGLVAGTVTTAPSSTVPYGNVISVSPAAGASVSTGSTVNLVVSGPGSSATYVGPDTTTGGNWTGHYGSNGFSIANDSTNNTIPSALVALSFTGDSLYTWSSGGATTSPALQVSSGSSSYLASCYYAGASFNIDLGLGDGNTHKISLYLLDYDSQGRAETISILNASTNAVLSTQSFSNFTGGEYAVWNITGNVIIQVTTTAGVNSVVSGIFVD
jgi:Divergent InlB B-repeat domain/PASTA domain